VTPLAHILTPIEEFLTDVLVWFHTSIGLTWAWAIVVLVATVRIVILPLTIKQIRSMQRLQMYAPQLKALQQKYKHDKQRMNEEVMKFYKEHKVNPAASCLPILPQIPIFFALFYVLRDFKEEVIDPRFPDSTISFLNGLVPDISADVNEHWTGWLLLVIYVGSQLLSFYLSTTAVQSKAQRYVFMALPFLFIPFVINFPVGLMIYWVTTNLWTVGQGIVTRRLYPRPELEPPKRTSRTPPKGEEGGDGAARPKAPKPSPPTTQAKKPAASGGGGSQQRPVRRRKKKGSRARR
jgi:YidC/Oxa1 family membrane protein insertase